MIDKKRWNNNIGTNFLTSLINVFKKGGVLNTSPFGIKEGFSDLQGISIPSNIKINNISVNKTDFSESDFKGCWIENSQFIECLFEKGNLSKVKDHRNIFRKCIFNGTNFKESVLGYDGSNYDDCVFNRTSFKKVSFIRAEFNNCSFIDCDLNSIDFNASSFVNCKFEGILCETWFRGGYKFEQDSDRFGEAKKNEMKNVSFEKAELKSVIFSNNCLLNSITLPSNGNYKKISSWKIFLMKMSEESNNLSEKDKNELKIFIKVHLVHANNQDIYVLNYQDIFEEHGKQVADYIWTFLNNPVRWQNSSSHILDD